MLVVCMLTFTGCSKAETVVEEVISELTEAPELPKFIVEPEKTIADITLPSAYKIEENQMPELRNQEDTNGCWAFASLSAL